MLYRALLEVNSVKDILTSYFNMRACKQFIRVVLLQDIATLFFFAKPLQE